MAQQIVNLGSTPNDGTGDTLRDGGQKINDNFTELYGFVTGVSSWKQPVRTATTAALPANTYANGTSGVGATLTGNANGALAAQDGVTLGSGERLLVKDEATSSHNGVYVVTQVGDASNPYILTRASDSDQGTELPGAAVKVTEGSTNADTEFVCTTDGPVTIGTTALTFVRPTGTGLQPANNLSDVSSKVAAKDNISIKGADIASAATTDLSAATGDFVNITGTTTITSFGTAAAGVERTLRFTGALTLTHNATSLILPTSANITTAAGDTARFRSLGSGNWVCVGYQKANGQALAGSSSGSLTLPSIRFTNIVGGGSTVSLSGAVAGDDFYILGSGGDAPTIPAGWSIVGYSPSNSGWNGFTIYKRLTAADITAGSVTINWSGGWTRIMAGVCLVGAASGINFSLFKVVANSLASLHNGKAWAIGRVEANTKLLIFLSCRGNSANTSDIGTKLQEFRDTGSGTGSGALWVADLTSEGMHGPTFTFGSIGGYEIHIFAIAVRGT